MVEALQGAAPEPVPDPHAPETARASLDFIRDIVMISRADGDLLDAVIFTTALDANMAPVDRARDLAVTYGGVDNSAPDELRRPVSMHAIAQSLGLSPETVRRRTAKLVAEGRLVMTDKGVVAPREAVVSEAYKAIQAARYARVRRFHDELKALGALAEPAIREPPPPEPLVRAANRVVSEYMLRSCGSLLSLTGDILTSLVLLQLVLANIQEMDGETLRRWIADPAALARPARVAGLTAGLPVSGETVRRHLRALHRLGWCGSATGELVAIPAPGSRPVLAAMAQENRANLHRLFHRLATLGVLAEWEAEERS